MKEFVKFASKKGEDLIIKKEKVVGILEKPNGKKYYLTDKNNLVPIGKETLKEIIRNVREL